MGYVSRVDRVGFCAGTPCYKKHRDRRSVCMNKFVFKAYNMNEILATGRKSSNDVMSRRDFSSTIEIQGRTADRAVIV